MSAEKDLRTAKSMIDEAISYIRDKKGKAYMLGDSVYFERKEHMNKSKLKISQIIDKLQQVKDQMR
tara:strand:+ start:138 stop:335 length:198 start_codon:yes stop_codon:yes gene_type:complete